MPKQIVEAGGLMPHTNQDAAKYGKQLQRFDWVGAKGMPRGELDGKTIGEIKVMLKQKTLRPQIYGTGGLYAMLQRVGVDSSA